MNNETEQIFLVNAASNPATIHKDAIPGATLVNLESVQDFSTVCRTCATITEFVIPIFEGEGLQNNLADKIHKHLPIQVLEDDALPRVVCYQCASTLLAWHELVKCCVQADEALRARLAQMQQATAAALLESEWGSSKGEQNKEDKSKIELAIEITIKREDTPFIPEAEAALKEKHHVTCGTCQKKLRKESWRRHQKIHNDERKYCDVCGMGFTDSGNLARHKHTHENLRAHICEICHKAYSRSSHLQDHVNSQHSNVREFVCEVCGKASKSKATLRMHKKTHDQAFKFKCMECGAQFKRRGELRAHVSVHTGERAHVCACGKAFRLRGQLTLHARTHKKVAL